MIIKVNRREYRVMKPRHAYENLLLICRIIFPTENIRLTYFSVIFKSFLSVVPNPTIRWSSSLGSLCATPPFFWSSMSKIGLHPFEQNPCPLTSGTLTRLQKTSKSSNFSRIEGSRAYSVPHHETFSLT